MVIGGNEAMANAQGGAHPSGVPQDKIDNIMSGISNTGAVKMNNHRKKLRQRFDIIKKLGQGTYGKVQLGINKETGQEVAIKTIKKCKIEAEADLIRIRREVQIMSSVQHPNIIHIYEVFENREKMVLVMEFAAGGELYDYLSERKVLSEDEARRIFRQVSTAVYYCHKHKICHRDLKLENILLDETGNAKIADFGLSNVFADQRLLETFCGSPLYASPEIVKGTPYQGPEVDCWSLGVLLYTLVYGAMPFDGSNFKRLVKQISQGDYYEPKKPSSASPLIKEMLTVCPKRRATIEQICSHWWVNEGYKESCLELAEDLANQTPVRLDVLLSLSPVSVTADQLVVPVPGENKADDRVARSHSVGSIRDMGDTEAERRILDMVAAGGEAALMPSPTRTMTPAESPVQVKRKLENTVSTENATGGVKKKERPTEALKNNLSKLSLSEMEIDQKQGENDAAVTNSNLIKNHEIPTEDITTPTTDLEEKRIPRQRTITKLDAVNETEECSNEGTTNAVAPATTTTTSAATTTTSTPSRTIQKFLNKHKTADLVSEINKISTEKSEAAKIKKNAERKSSLPDENLTKTSERRRSRVFETAEKLQNMNNSSNDKSKRIVIPGVSVGTFKKEFERRASLTNPAEIQLEKKTDIDDSQRKNDNDNNSRPNEEKSPSELENNEKMNKLETSDSKGSGYNISLDEARRSMENSIALLNQAKNESSKEVDQLCAKTENVAVSEGNEREKKLQNAREIIGNAINPGGGRLCMGVRKPPVPFGMNGRSISGNVISPTSFERRLSRQTSGSESIDDTQPETPQPTVKTSRAEITLKSATLPRRKPNKIESFIDIQPKITEQQPMRFSTEMQHQVNDLRSAPIRLGQSPFSPLPTYPRASSMEPQLREHLISAQKPNVYKRSGSNTIRSNSLSRQSTTESEASTITTPTYTSSSQPIKKSPREFIIPIAVEGGGYVTPRAGSLEPSESSQTSSSTAFSRINRPRRIGSLLNDIEPEKDYPFQKLRSTSKNMDGDMEEPRLLMHRLSRSTRPSAKMNQDANDSQSSGEEDDEDGFEILTAENLFSTLLQRVRALTNRLNVNNGLPSGFPNSRLLDNVGQSRSPFWQHEPFGSRLKNTGPGAWKHTLPRDLETDIDSMFARTGATLPRGTKNKKKNHQISETDSVAIDETTACPGEEAFDLADLDLSRLKLSKQDLETLSGITPELPKHFQEQLLAKLRPNQARKLSRTLSMRNDSHLEPIKVYKRSLSGGQDIDDLKYGNNIKNEYSNGDLYKENKHNNDHNNKILQKSDSRARSRTRFDNENDSKSRNSSVCRSSDDFTQSFCSQHSNEVNGKYKYYSPYLEQKAADIERALSPKKYSGSSSPQSICISPAKDLSGRPPSGCLSPPPVACDNSLRKRSSQKRISRFLRPDFYDLPAEESIYVRRRKEQERETQSVLREIREKSLDRTSERLEEIVNEIRYNDRKKRQESLPRDLLSYEPYSNGSYSKENLGYSSSRISNRDKFNESSSSALDELRRHRRSLSRPREHTDEYVDTSSKAKRVNQILQELQDTSANIVVEKNQMRSSSVQPPDKVISEKITKDVQQPVTSVKSNSEENGDVAKPITTKVKTKKSSDSIGKKSSKISKKQNSSKDETLSIAKPSLNEPSIKSTNDADDGKKEGIKLRPKSELSKEVEKKVIDSSKTNGVGTQTPTNQENETFPVEEECNENCRSVRPKSYPNSKIAVSKDLRNSNYANAVGGILNSKAVVKKEEKPANKSLVAEVVSSVSEEKTVPVKIVEEIPTVEVKLKIKKVAKSKQESVDPLKIEAPTDDSLNSNTAQVKDKNEKCVEKKTGKGILHAIGQKFEKLCENARSSKDKKPITNTNADSTLLKDDKTEEEIKSAVPATVEKSSIKSTTSPLKKKKPKVSAESLDKPSASTNGETITTTEKSDKKSRVDQMIRTLRERSVPRMPAMTESGLIKRAVSVEDMPGSFNKCSVNKVLGLFKKFEKDGGTEKKILNTQSTSNIEAHIKNNTSQKQRPKSIGFVSKLRKNNTFLNKSADASTSGDNSKFAQQQKPVETDLQILAHKRASDPFLKNIICTDCNHEVLANSKVTGIGAGVGVSAGCQLRETESSPNNRMDLLKYKRKSLTLDCNKYHDMADQRRNVTINGNIISDIGNNSSSYEINNKNNNNNMNNGIENHELNQNFLPLMYKDNLTNSSSDCKSLHDDCTLSTSLRSPTEEPELCFDNWSICSDDNNSTMNIHSPTNLSSKASRASQFSPPSSVAANNEPTESVIDRIKRRSFYCRFNEKKPKRQSNIVSPAAREYYRETQAKRLSRPPDRLNSPELKATTTKSTGISSASNNSHHHHHHHHDYDYRPPPPPVNYDKTGDNIKTYNIKLTDSNNLRTNYNNVLSSKSIGSSTKRPIESDIFRSRHHITSSYEPSCCSSYSTYNSYNRQPSSHLNGLTSSHVTSRNIDSYATLNRRIRPYDQRSISLLTPSSQGISTVPSSLDILRRDHQRNTTTELGNHPRSNLRVRTSSLSRSPTKI